MGSDPGDRRTDDGQRALDEARWDAAREAFESVLGDQETPEALDGLGLALWFLGDVTGGVAARERAVEGYARTGRCDDAARTAVWVSHQHFVAGRSSAARGWLARAERAVDESGLCAGQGWVAAERARHAETVEECAEHARRALEIARQTDANDLEVSASDLTPALLEAGRGSAEAEGLELEWVEADAENLPFADESFDVVMSAIGVMFAPQHQVAADELVRVCRVGGKVGLLSWTPEGMLGALFATMKPFAPAPPPGVQPPPLWGSENYLRELLGDRVELETLAREPLEITAFHNPRGYGEHFNVHYGPTIAVRANAEREGRAQEFDDALDAFCDEWNLGTDENSRFAQEYLVAVGTKR